LQKFLDKSADNIIITQYIDIITVTETQLLKNNRDSNQTMVNKRIAK